MAYLAIARKWRPSRFEDLVGQGHVVQTLRNAISLDRVSHAYLFSGARGIGKTSVARIFAKALRCPEAKGASPCNQCAECLAINDSRSVDVAEIDGASNNGVEAVRGIRENVAYLPSSGKYKIYIIDEVHMLSLSAFNALLKTLEEPPAHVIFIFATTEVQKIPLTILSRCQRFEFRRLTNTQIVDRLKQILDVEGLRLAEEALRTLASHADGALRDALSLLDQVLSYYGERKSSDGTLDEKQVVEALGVHETRAVTEFLQLVIDKNVKGLVSLIGATYNSGVDLKHFAESILEETRLLYLLTLAKENGDPITADELDIAAQHFTRLSAMTAKTSLVQVERMAQLLGKTATQVAWSSLPRFVLEMAAVRMTKLDQLAKIEASLTGGRLPTPPTAAPESGESTAPSDPYGEERPTPIANPDAPKAQATWKGFVEVVMKKRPMLGTLLTHAEFKIEGNHVTLAYADGSFYQRQAADPKFRLEVEEMLKAYFGRDAQLTLSSNRANTIASIEHGKQAEAAELRKTALEHPTVTKVKEICGAEIVDVNVEV